MIMIDVGVNIIMTLAEDLSDIVGEKESEKSLKNYHKIYLLVDRRGRNHWLE